MAQSPEYPDLKWMPPKSFTKDRRPGCPRVVIIHSTEGSERATSAEDGAAYDQRRTDGTSAHYYHDQDSTVQCVRTTDEAHGARTRGNDIGIQHELCGKAGQTDALWADAASEATIRRAAKQVARDCRKWRIPAVKLTAGQVAAGKKGICGHADITTAFPQDKGTHWDPGPHFPWTHFLALVRQAELTGTPTPTPAPKPGLPAPGPAMNFPLPAGYYFGPRGGPDRSVSGCYGRVFKGHPDYWWLQQWAGQLSRRGWVIGKGKAYLGRYGNDGRYGGEYRALIEAFQRDQGLKSDGLLGAHTWNAAYHNPVTK